MRTFLSHMFLSYAVLSLRSDRQILETTKTGTAHERVCENGSPRGSNTSAGGKNEGRKYTGCAKMIGATDMAFPQTAWSWTRGLHFAARWGSPLSSLRRSSLVERHSSAYIDWTVWSWELIFYPWPPRSPLWPLPSVTWRTATCGHSSFAEQDHRDCGDHHTRHTDQSVARIRLPPGCVLCDQYYFLPDPSQLVHSHWTFH